MDKNSTINKIADEAVADYYEGESKGTLSQSIAKVAVGYGVNELEVGLICPIANHRVFQNKYAQDKLATFDIAKKEKVLGIMYPKRKVAVTISVSKTAGVLESIYKTAGAEVVDEGLKEQMEKDVKEKTTANTMEAGANNADILNSLIVKRDGLSAGLYNKVLTLYQSGVQLNEIYETLKKSWGDHNNENTSKVFKEIIDRMVSDGYISDDSRGDMDKDKDYDDYEIEPGNVITETANKIASLNDDILVRTVAQCKIAGIIKTAGKDKEASDLIGMIIDDDLKLMIKDGGAINSTMNAVKNVFRGKSGDMINDIGRSALVLGTLSSLAYLGNKGIIEIKKPATKNKLLTKYPEMEALNNSNPQLFKDLFDTLVVANPSYLDMPFALMSLIRKHSEYGVIDANTIKTLGSSRPSNPLESLESNLSGTVNKLVQQNMLGLDSKGNKNT